MKIKKKLTEAKYPINPKGTGYDNLPPEAKKFQGWYEPDPFVSILDIYQQSGTANPDYVSKEDMWNFVRKFNVSDIIMALYYFDKEYFNEIRETDPVYNNLNILKHLLTGFDSDINMSDFEQ